MRTAFLIVLTCLMLAAPAAAVTLVPRLITTIDISPLADVSCSADSFSPSPNNTIIWVIFQNGNGDVYIDGVGKMPMWGETSGGKPGLQYAVAPGLHTVVVSREGYTNYSATVQACSGKVSYVNYDQTDYVITTTTTTIPTTLMVVPVTTTQLAATTTAVQTTSIASALPDMLGSISVTTTPAGAFIFIDGVQRGVSPATIPGLSAGTHTILLKLDGYQDLSSPVTIVTEKTQDYSTAMVKNAAAGATQASSENTTAGTNKAAAPGFEFMAALTGIGAILAMKKRL
jgi:hypothetical protein